MKDLESGTATAMSIVRNCLVVTLQGELYQESLMRIRTDILQKIQATKVRGMMLDFCTVRVLDSFAFNFLADTAKMTSLLGVTSLFVDLQPGVVSALVDLEVKTDDIHTALTMEDGFEQINSFLSVHTEPPEAEDSENILIENDERLSLGDEGFACGKEE